MPERLEGEISLGYREFLAGVDATIQASKKLEGTVGSSMDAASQQTQAALIAMTQQLKTTQLGFRELMNQVGEASGKISKSLDLRAIQSQLVDLGSKSSDAFKQVIGSGANFEQALLRINTIAGLSDDQLASLGEQLRNTGKEIGASASPAQAAASYYEILSSGFTNTADASKVLNASLKLAAGGQADAADTTRALTGVLNAYGDSSDKAALRADQFFTIVDRGVTTVPELAKSLGLVTTVAASANVPFEELGAAISAATLKGQTTGAALEGIRGVIGSLITPTSGAQKELARLGIVIDANTLKQKGLIATLNELNQAAGGNIDSINKVIEGQVGLATALALTSNSGKEFKASFDAISGAAGRSEKAIAEVNKGLIESEKQLSDSFERLKVSASKSVLPFATAAVKALTTLVDAFDEIPAPIKTVGLAVLGFAGIFGALGGAMAGAALVLPGILTQLKNLGGIVGPALTKGLSALGKEYTVNGAAGAVWAKSLEGLKTAGKGVIDVFTNLGKAVASDAAAVVASAAVYALLGAEIIAMADKYAKANEAREKFNSDLVSADSGISKAGGDVRAFNTGNLLSGKSAEQLFKQGATSDTVTERIRLLRNRIEGETVTSGLFGSSVQNNPLAADDPQRKKLEGQIRALKELRAELSLLEQKAAKPNAELQIADALVANQEALRQGAHKTAEEEKKAADERFKDEKQAIDLSKAGHQQKIDQLEDLKARYQQDGDKRRSLEVDIHREQETLDREAEARKKKQQGERVKQDIQTAEAPKDDAQRLKNLQALATKYKDLGDVRRTIEDKIRVVEDRMQKQREADIKKLRDQKKAAADEEIKDAEANLAKLQHLQDRGVDTTAQQKTELRKSADAAKRKVDVELDEKTAGADTATTKAASTNATREKLRIEQAYQDQVKVLDEKTTQDRIQRSVELNATELETANQRLDIYKQLGEAGAASEFQIRSAIEERYKAQVKAADLQAQLVKSQTDDVDKISQAEKAAAVAKVQAENEKARATEETTEALKRQRKEADAGRASVGSGGVLSVADFASSLGSLDLSPESKRSMTPKEVARQRKLLDAANSTTKGKDVKSAVDGAGVTNALQTVAQALAAAKKIDIGIDIFDGNSGNKIPSRVRKATVDGKGSDVETAGRRL